MKSTGKSGFRALAMGAATALLVLAGATSGEARDLTYAIGFPPGSMVDKSANRYAEFINKESGGELTVKVFPLSLMNLIETGPGLRDGLSDIGYVLSPYYAAEYAHSNFINELNMAGLLAEPSGTESLAFTGAVIDYVMTQCPTCLDEFKAQNQVFMGGGASTPYLLLCNKPVATIEDMRGKRIRAGAGSFQRFAEGFGAVGVQMAANEVFEGLSQGVLDCAMLSAPDLQNLVLEEVVSDITLGAPGGIYTSAQVNVNLGVWQELTDDQRKLLLRASALASAEMSWMYHASAAEVLDKAKTRGTKLHELAPDTRTAIQDFVRKDHESIVVQYQEKYGVADAEAMAKAFMPVLEKWNGLVKDVKSADELQELYWTEIYAKVDPATYGMN